MTLPAPDLAVDRRRDPAFLIVGTTRSGTTLVQRLACSLDGVRVPPETHFRNFMRSARSDPAFPLGEADLRAVLARFAGRSIMRDVPLDADAIVADLGGVCADPWTLFAAIVRDLAGPAATYGEKTPEHLRWWEPMTRHFPAIRIVAVVREPRAVVASNLRVPFGPASHHLLAERWRTDQRLVRAARSALGPGRCLVLRYEDVVADPDRARTSLGSFLEVDAARPADVAPGDLHREWEWWKDRAAGPITTDRVDAWRDELSPAQARDVVAICRPAMRAFGYGAPGATASALRRLSFPPSVQRLRIRHRRAVRAELRRVRAL